MMPTHHGSHAVIPRSSATGTPAWCQRWRERRHSWRRASAGGFDPGRYRVEPVEEHHAKAFVLAHHYLASYPAAIHRFGLTERVSGELVGVAVLAAPASARVLTRPFPTLAPYLESVELARFVLLDDVPANAESWMLARVFTQLRERGVRGVVSFADPIPRWASSGRLVMPGHVGIIYQACNAVYAGRATPRSLVVLPDGSSLSARAMQKVRSGERGHRYVQERLVAAGANRPEPGQDTAEWLAGALQEAGARRIRHRGMHRYLFRLGSRREREAIALGLPAHPGYPKQVDVHMSECGGGQDMTMAGRSEGAQIPTREAAALVGMSPEHFHVAMHRARKRQVDLRTPESEWPDGRTPMWDRERLLEWDRDRQRGRGRPRTRIRQVPVESRDDEPPESDPFEGGQR